MEKRKEIYLKLSLTWVATFDFVLFTSISELLHLLRFHLLQIVTDKGLVDQQ